jgi:Ca2+-binding RTX toxin-like protein
MPFDTRDNAQYASSLLSNSTVRRNDDSDHNAVIDPITDTALNQRDAIEGDDNHNRLVGTSEEDLIYAFAGDDFIRGFGEDDTIYAGNGDDTVRGDQGDDSLFGATGDDILYGGEGDDTIEGGNGDDILRGEEGYDLIYGGDGNDGITGGAGNDTLYGGDGDDYLITGAGSSNIADGGEGDDLIIVGMDAYENHYSNSSSFVQAGNGNDYIIAGAGRNYINGGAGFDTLDLSSSDSALELNLLTSRAASSVNGIDSSEYSNASGSLSGTIALGTLETIKMSNFDDDVTLGADDITLYTGAGADEVSGFTLIGIPTLHYTIYTEEGNDRIWIPGNSKTYADLGSGNDTATVLTHDATVHGGDGNDRLYISRATHSNYLNGGKGGDLLAIFKSVGINTLNGGDGNDTLFIRSENTDEFLYGGNGRDTIRASGGSDYIWGGNGDDYIETTNLEEDGVSIGTSTIEGGMGADRLVGSDVAETYVYRSMDESTSQASDRIWLFSKEDRIDLSAIEIKNINELTIYNDGATTYVGYKDSDYLTEDFDFTLTFDGVVDLDADSFIFA